MTILALTPVQPITPGSVIDGAVAELAVRPDGTVTAEIRIPGPASR
jgi:hypothetical protein